MKPDAVVVGVDLGATNVRVGLFDPQGRTLEMQEKPLDAHKGPETGIRLTIELIEQVLSARPAAPLQGIGVGATGPVDPVHGTIQNPYTLPSWQFVPFTAPLSQHFGVPVVLENDADVAALGEYWQGAGKGVKRLYAVTVGTGIGVAYIQDGHIFRGFNGAHPEGGHHIVDPSGPECYCGAFGCWESLASGEALSEYARQQAGSRPEWMRELGVETVDEINGALVAQSARRGDALAIQVMQREAKYLALGLLNVIDFFVPEVIVLSGGVIRSYDLLEPAVRALMARNSLMVPAKDVKIVPAQLGYYAGVTGAAYALLTAITDDTV